MVVRFAGMKFNRSRLDAYRLLHEGQTTLAHMENAGIKIDTNYLRKSIDNIDKVIKTRHRELLDNNPDVVEAWRRRYGKNTNMDSGDQIGTIFYKDLGYESKNKTATGKFKTNIEALSKIDHPFIRGYLEIKKLKTATGTFLNGLRNELTSDGFVHPLFHLHFVVTYRSSSSDPNFQNLPSRNYEIMQLVKRCFISRFKNGHIVERDFKAVEVAVAACYHKDPTMLQYLKDGFDLHLDMGSQIFLCKKSQVPKKARYEAKNKFVFPQFYGSFYVDCARNIWDACLNNPFDIEGVPVFEWLKKHGIKKLGLCDEKTSPKKGTFEKHIKDIEEHFWNNRFPVYTQWKRDWYNAYKQNGLIPFYTGFLVEAINRRNEVINYPIQGSAFHCTLWSACEIRKKLKKYKMKSILIGQVHDSLIGDSPENELQDFLDISEEVTSKGLKKHWDWIITPIGTEVEVAPAGKSWADKQPWEKKDVWRPVLNH